MKVKELLTNKSKWTKHVEARTKDGDEVDPKNPSASKFCLVGAVIKCYPPSKRHKIFTKLYKSIGYISLWNDKPSIKFADVKKLINKLNI